MSHEYTARHEASEDLPERRPVLFEWLAARVGREQLITVVIPAQLEALERLIEVANGCTGQCRYVANFLLAWENAPKLGGFDPRDLWSLDYKIRVDVCSVFELIAKEWRKPDPDSLDSYQAGGR